MDVPGVLRVKIQNSNDELVCIYPDELEDKEAIMSLFAYEIAPLSTWIDCALHFYRHDKIEAFLQFLSEPVQPEALKILHQFDKKWKVNLLALHQIGAAHDLDKLQQYGDVTDVQALAIRKSLVTHLNKADEYSKPDYNPTNALLKALVEVVIDNKTDMASRYVNDVRKMLREHPRLKFLVCLVQALLHTKTVKFDLAIKCLCEAIETNPVCGASVRAAIGVVCFAGQHFKRAEACFSRALDIEPYNPTALLGLAMTQAALVSGDGAQTPIHTHTHTAFKIRDNIQKTLLAATIDPSHSSAVFRSALINFWRFTFLSEGTLVSPNSVEFCIHKTTQDEWHLKRGVTIRMCCETQLYHAATITDIQIIPNPDAADEQSVWYQIAFEPTFDSHEAPLGCRLQIEARNIDPILKEVTRVLEHTRSPVMRADLLYVLGKCCHSVRQYQAAANWYEKSLRDNPKMMLASFGLGQVQLARGDPKAALASFEKVHTAFPEDPHTHAYLALLDGTLNARQFPVEKLSEILKDFPCALDVWMVQAEIRLNTHQPSDLEAATKCYASACELIKSEYFTNTHTHEQQRAMLADVYNNTCAAYMYLGKWEEAQRFSEQCLETVEGTMPEGEQLDSYFRCSTNNVFFRWSEVIGRVQKNTQTLGARSLSLLLDDEAIASSVVVGVDLLINDCLCVRVERVESQQSTIDIHLTSDIAELIPDNHTFMYTVRLKNARGNFHSDTLVYAFNYACVREGQGDDTAAEEVCMQILRINPTYAECYVKLSNIYERLGKMQTAEWWLKEGLKALGPTDGLHTHTPTPTHTPTHTHTHTHTHTQIHTELTLAYTELISRNHGRLQEARRAFEALMPRPDEDQTKRRNRVCVNLGNIYNKVYAQEGGDWLRNASRLYRHTFVQAPNQSTQVPNDVIPAAAGVGIVCAIAGADAAAKSILTRLRECSNPQTLPLHHVFEASGHVSVVNHKYRDAIALYSQAVVSKHTHTPTSYTHLHALHHSRTRVCEYISLAQFKDGQFKESCRSLCVCLRQAPHNDLLWFNLAYVLQSGANDVFKTQTAVKRTVHQLGQALADLKLANKFFSNLRGTFRNTSLAKKDITDFSNKCSRDWESGNVRLQHEQAKEETAKMQELARQQALQEDLDRKKAAMEAAREESERTRQELHRRALEKETQLQALTGRWKVAASEEAPKKAHKGKKNQPKEGAEDEGVPGIYDSDEEVKPVKARSSKRSRLEQYSEAGERPTQPTAQDEAGSAPVSKRAKPPSRLTKAKKNDGQLSDDDDLFGDDSENDDDAATKRKMTDESMDQPSVQRPRIEDSDEEQL